MRYIAFLFFFFYSAIALSQESYSNLDITNYSPRDIFYTTKGKQYKSYSNIFVSYNFMMGFNNNPSFIGLSGGAMFYKKGFWISIITNKYNNMLKTFPDSTDQEDAIYLKRKIKCTSITFNNRFFINPLISMYTGLGYGWRDYLYVYDVPEKGTDIDKTKSSEGIVFEFGSLLTYQNSVFSFGIHVLNLNPNTLNFTFGIGKTF